MPDTPAKGGPNPSATPYPSVGMANVMSAVRAMDHPTQIGPYAIEELIGEGGMGTVYRAVQSSPIKRTVALKIIKLGMDTRQVIARFESERQALAMMNHPNVAKVLDAGATDTGRPYFVMEYVSGDPITAYADRKKLTVRDRLELFVQACDAVQHAHHKAIIHRDLKPSNILVDEAHGKATVKVIDFGVAKAINSRLTERTLFTETGQLVGTPEFMAPEQADAALDVDTRSDVYALGVVLYELLAGALPFDAGSLRSAGYQEIQRIIREVDPPRPSTRLTRLGAEAEQVARLRQVAVDSLTRQLKGELEWIPLKAMRKNRDDRYASVQELADDVENYLAHRPLRAGPESRRYRLAKFMRRNKRGVAAAAVMLLLIIGGLVATTWQMIRATRAEREAVAAKDNLTEVNRFLTEDLLFSASPEVSRGRDLTVKEAVDRAADSVGDRFRDRPLIEAGIRLMLGQTYQELGQTETGLSHAEKAVAILQRERGSDHEETLTAVDTVARMLSTLNRHSEAEPMIRDAISRTTRLLGAEHPLTLNTVGALAMSLRMQHRYDEAEPLYRRLLEIERRLHGPDSAEAAQALNNLAVLLNTVGRAAEAEPLFREALVIREKALGTDHPSYLNTMSNLARVLETQKKTAAAAELHERVLAEKRRVLKDDHPSTTLTMNNLAVMYFELGRVAEAEALHREALERRRRTLGDEAIETLQSTNNLGTTLAFSGRDAEAEPFLKATVEGRTKAFGPMNAQALNPMATLSKAYFRQGKFDEALALLNTLMQPEALAVFPPAVQSNIVARYGIVSYELNDPRAEGYLLDGRAKLVAANQQNGDGMRETLKSLIKLYEKTNRPTEAAEARSTLAASEEATRPTTAATRPG